jgi:hypothetical protein
VYYNRDKFAILIMEAVSTSETSANLYETTRRKIPEDSHFHTGHRQNPKSHLRRHISGDRNEWPVETQRGMISSVF